ncbi:DUF3080 family protein [Pseudoalteromonas espejiana]
MFNYTLNNSKNIGLFILTALCFFALAGCTKAPSNSNKTYIERLSNTLQTPKPQLNKLTTISPLLLPEKALNNTTISLIELAGLSHCKLSILISEHNNQLGKTAGHAGILKYQIDFIQNAQQCLATLKPSSKIYKTLLSAKNNKEQSLNHYFNLMLYNETELKNSWQASSAELSSSPAGFSDTVEAMQQLVAIKYNIETKQYLKISSTDIFKALEILNKYRFNQQLINTARLQIAFNNSATQFVNTQRLADICPLGKNKKTANIVSNVFQKFYLGEIQPYQANLAGYLETLLPLYHQLWFNQPVTNKQINALIDSSSKTNLLNQLKMSAKSHVTWWQKFYKTCEISPI